MANAIEQKVAVSGTVGDLRLTVEQRPDPPEGKESHSDNPCQLYRSMQHLLIG
jgi:hypothetical protein